ncbi:MAG: NADP-dependent phosphogluconate dehydrogenase [Pseudomonadales bacterium]|nr:NADP-dependent phosphogluconate dehydrogenase [Pseudomonadales bacterium]
MTKLMAGMIGLGVMGRNLALNMADSGCQMVVFDTDRQSVERAVAESAHDGQPRFRPVSDLVEMLAALPSPRIIFLSVPAGSIVDQLCDDLLRAGADKHDIVIDTGNSLWTDSVARAQHYEGRLNFFTTAVSGGEMGARTGPSLMASGDFGSWQRVAPVLHGIAARVDDQGRQVPRLPGQATVAGESCATWTGPAGTGHYVKMVHNGIEYADMQLICEAYSQLRFGLGLSMDAVAETFERWNEGPLNSYLMEITAEVLRQLDPDSGVPLVDVILDSAGQKGTGMWTAVSSLELGCPAPSLAGAVFARSLSARKSQRLEAARLLQGPADKTGPVPTVSELEDALYCGKICAYAQGFDLMLTQARQQGWTLDLAAIARVWRAGCIIRAVFLNRIAAAFEADQELAHLLLDADFSAEIALRQKGWRQTVASAALNGIPASGLSASLAYYDGFRAGVLPANLLQAQRDYFGAHGFRRVDEPLGEYHLEWHATPRSLTRRH